MDRALNALSTSNTLIYRLLPIYLVPRRTDRGTKQTVSPAHTRMHVRERAYTRMRIRVYMRYVYIYVCVYACEYNSLVNHMFVCACVYFDIISNRKTLYDLKILILSI